MFMYLFILGEIRKVMILTKMTISAMFPRDFPASKDLKHTVKPSFRNSTFAQYPIRSELV